MTRVLAVTATLAALAVGLSAQHPTGTAGAKAPPHILLTPAEATWGPAPPGLPAGAEVAVLEGDPSQPGPFTMRAKLPAGYRIAPHWHPQDEHVTVLEGTFLMGMGESFSEGSLKSLDVGGFAVMPKGTRHFAATKGDTLIQIHGIGPWGINYVNPSDDPRNLKK
jgi:quercetin dioxygenase-like cupin family protein